MTGFDVETALTATGAGTFAGSIDAGWFIPAGGPNGGYLAAIVLPALTGGVTDDRFPRSLTLHYLDRPKVGPIEVATTVEREGRSFSSVSARMTQEGRTVVLALGAFSRHVTDDVAFDDTTAPEVPPAERCSPLPTPPEAPPIFRQYETRPAIGSLPFTDGPEAVAGGWIRLAEPRVVDPLLAAAFTDAWFPAVFSRTSEPVLVPTIDLTIHFRTRLPLEGATAEDFTLATFRSRLAAGGLVEEDGELWSADGRLLAQSRQLALYRPGIGRQPPA